MKLDIKKQTDEYRVYRHYPTSYENIYDVLQDFYTPQQFGEIWDMLRKFDIKLAKENKTK